MICSARKVVVDMLKTEDLNGRNFLARASVTNAYVIFKSYIHNYVCS